MDLRKIRLNSDKYTPIVKPSENQLHTQLNIVTFKAKDKLHSKQDVLVHIKNHKVQIDEQRLLLAVQLNNTEHVQRLLESGVNPNACDKSRRSALHIAASRGYTNIIRLLLEYKADPNATDIIQNTPLHLAACNSNLQVIKILIDGGADLRLLDKNGRNSLQLAESKLQLLRKYWKKGTVDLKHVCGQVQDIVDLMITFWMHRDATNWGHHRDNVDDLKQIRNNFDSETHPTNLDIDDQLGKLLTELKDFSIN